MNNENKKIRINAVDVIITMVVLFVLAVGGFMIARSFGVGSAGNKNQSANIEYTVQFRAVRDVIADNVEIGEIAVDAQKRQQLGEVTGFYFQDYLIEFFDYTTHEPAIAPCPGYKDVFVKFKATATADRDGNYYVNGVRIAYGTTLAVHLPDFCKEGTVCKMTIGEVN